MATVATRNKTELFLLGQPITNLVGAKLPSKGEVLRLFYHLHLHKCHTIRQAAASVVDQVTAFWDKARIPMRRKDHCITQMENLHAQWLAIKKNKSRQSTKQQQREEDFVKGRLQNPTAG